MTRTLFLVCLSGLTLMCGGCANNAAARRAAVAVRGSLIEYQTSIDDKIAEQQAYYAKRRERIAAARQDDNDDQLGLSRRVRALEYASKLTADAAGQVRIDNVLDHLKNAVEADFEQYRSQRAAEASAAKEYDAALETIGRESAAIAAARNALGSLATRATRRERIQAAAEFAAELHKKLAEQNSKDAAAANENNK